MMAMKINWRRLKEVHKHLIDHEGLTGGSDLICILIFTDGSANKTSIKFNDFMRFFWDISGDMSLRVLALVVQDKEGKILYRHREITPGNEEIPNGGQADVVVSWNALNKTEKETYIRLLISQIQAYE